VIGAYDGYYVWLMTAQGGAGLRLGADPTGFTPVPALAAPTAVFLPLAAGVAAAGYAGADMWYAPLTATGVGAKIVLGTGDMPLPVRAAVTNGTVWLGSQRNGNASVMQVFSK
jgi:hypothetical protein